MATIEKAFTYLLNSISGLTAVNAGRIWDTKMPDGPTLPATTFQFVSEIADHTSSGRSTLVRRSVQLQHWSTDKEQVIAMAAAAKQFLDGFRGFVQIDGSDAPTGVTQGTWFNADGNDVLINGVLLQNALDLYDDDTRVFRRMQQFLLIFQES